MMANTTELSSSRVSWNGRRVVKVRSRGISPPAHVIALAGKELECSALLHRVVGIDRDQLEGLNRPASPPDDQLFHFRRLTETEMEPEVVGGLVGGSGLNLLQFVLFHGWKDHPGANSASIGESFFQWQVQSAPGVADSLVAEWEGAPVHVVDGQI